MLHTIDFNKISYAMRVDGGATLVFSNVQLFDLAPSSAYSYSSSTPWRSTGQGTTTWPSIGLAVNATVRLKRQHAASQPGGLLCVQEAPLPVFTAMCWCRQHLREGSASL